MKFILFFCLIVSTSTLCCAADDARSLIEGVLTRSEQIVSGRIKWQRNQEVDKPIFNSFSGNNWAEGGKRFLAGEDNWKNPINVNYNNLTLMYVQNKQLDGTIYRRVLISEPISLAEKSNGHKQLYTIPYWAGHFWELSQILWTKEHVNDFKFIRDDIIDNIPVKVIEAQISKEHNDEFPFAIWYPCKNTAILRLYVAPQLGYTLPRIEEIVDGSLITRYDALNFEEKATGIFMPKTITRYLIKLNNGEKYTTNNGKLDKNFKELTYHLLEVQLLNEPIPESDFLINIQEKSVVTDNRFVPPKSYLVTNVDTNSINLEQKEKASYPELEKNDFNWWWVIGGGILISIFIIIIKNLKN